MRVGQKATLAFQSMNLEGAAVAMTPVQQIAVPFALPGEEAVVEITRSGRRAEGKILAMVRKSPETVAPRCRHFGHCGVCQWQHLPYEAQLRHKTALVREYFASALRGSRVQIRETIGAGPWEYRNRIQAAFDLRQDRLVAGYYAVGGETRLINVQECPIQHADNVWLLKAVREAVGELGWPIYDRESGGGLVRGMIGQVGFTSGEAMLVLSTTREIPDRMALVHAVRRRVLTLTSLLLSVQPAHTPDLLGRVEFLWGRPYVEDEIAGLRLRLYATAAIPPNPRAIPAWLEAIAQAAAATEGTAIFDAACEEGLVPLALARRARRVVGVAPDRDAMHRAWENARLNEVENVVFYTRSAAGVLAKLTERGEAFDAVITTSRGGAAHPALFQEAARSGVRRLVCAGHSLTLLAGDLRTASDAGYRPIEIQPVDLLPQTSRIHCVATLIKDR